ncbi:bifunctional 4-hydroxy-2-oxoglutarate aldolase/2-dehydro-3-deoxy-phosphogluconate aldolase [Thiomicrorhabdus heinhorstiae]|uniref:2-dehydro-3-deoxy-phosphogluconate aldolase n=1 Tax=Thiomicrorhabdus heinhorstiae TaxID=2748010 RepID=A0ABS0BT43_9GAMM|nr:bifunctional 4-hydroxy-2-oxoglutarate aldolase/2-dehydro-3-deoxy-phosphogluconate aldolase [Thiomicrorhabdus heinhorstiae]MBF6057011.1 bifunctional 4-hydroxy-2-oxoglutarate aldolase/2-dehydro-3-deoxy-phosphogluconate aldolase [Thiomicrorhabdus heinhorstiae]
MKATEILGISPIVPVVVLEDPKDALPLAEALLEGGIAVMEITLRSDAALASIEAIAKELPEMNVGAGTVVNAEQMLKVRDLGGNFSFSPGISTGLLDCAKEEGIPFIPGVATASEVMLAMEYGIEGCKLFPATAVGGIELLKGFAGPFGSMKFCPTGGVSLANMNDFLALPNVLCVGGSWIVPKTSVAEGDFSNITSLCKTALEAID